MLTDAVAVLALQVAEDEGRENSQYSEREEGPMNPVNHFCLTRMKPVGDEEERTRREPFATYQKKLIEDGVSSGDAEALAARLQRRTVDNPEWMAVNLNRLYSQGGAEAAHRDKPNAFLIETANDLRPGKALDLGMGEGRNAIYSPSRAGTSRGWTCQMWV